MDERVQTVIVGGGQAGLALSYWLAQAGHEHLVLEKAARPGEAWRNGRWDSFTLVTPNWTVRLPGAEYRGPDPDGYLPRDEIVTLFEQYQQSNRLPVQFHTSVVSVDADGAAGYTAQTLVDGQTRAIHARNVVIATGLFQRGKVPAYAASIPADVAQIHTSQYRNPGALPPGAVLIVGSGQSGGQIAAELHASGRKVYLSLGFAPLTPRRYRGKDIFAWLTMCGFLDRTAEQLPSPHLRFISNPLLTGKDGGRALNPHQFYRDGMVLLGRAVGFQDGCFHFAADLHENLARSDKAGADICAMIDGFIEKTQLDAPPEKVEQLTDGYQSALIETLDLAAAGIGTVVWASGYSFDYSLVHLPVTESSGFPATQRGETRYPGLYFLGMNWLHTPKSGLLLGVGEDAAYLAERIARRANARNP